MASGYPLRIPVICWQIPARPSGYPPEDLDLGVDAPFSLESWRVYGYLHGYPSEGPSLETLYSLEAKRNPSRPRLYRLKVDEAQPCRPEGLPSSREKSTNTASEMDSTDNFSLGHHWTHPWNTHGLEVTPLRTHITKPIPGQAHVTILKSPLSYAYKQLTVYT
ncbi:uncharacterized protein PGTG_15530 [Puccinia graminis f. sp. tritici CRL 75-36-700-3]|uniref:Uncharacterized protein n=1 Tax=Puccinia graminis f. sp. tritici (strain CRL 75-36-700-3 / race SCCL) TaxID=418459 RepID=E3KYG0_PUCGT|nr:uncharacterized protein PGTG_15530 [Puccinia graminis f. sp. tritici CRL 75-36-700-3]EFP89351.1 hypothetical protein PGTG_15530 [Puccinia graminis f. sp. tritici CRL 75-36-700-3]